MENFEQGMISSDTFKKKKSLPAAGGMAVVKYRIESGAFSKNVLEHL